MRMQGDSIFNAAEEQHPTQCVELAGLLDLLDPARTEDPCSKQDEEEHKEAATKDKAKARRWRMEEREVGGQQVWEHCAQLQGQFHFHFLCLKSSGRQRRLNRP